MKLFLMRHAQAYPAVEDPNRGLTPQGRADILRVLSQAPLKPGDIVHVMHSGALRTEQTARMVATQLKISDVQSCPQWLAEESDVDVCITLLDDWKENTLLVSHHPFLTRLQGELVSSNNAASLPQFSTATLVCLKKTNVLGWEIEWTISP